METLRTYFPGRRMVLLMGVSEDKDITGMLDELLPAADLLIATQSIHPRALEAGKLVEMAMPYEVPARAIVPLEEAFRAGLEQAQPDGVVLVTGSLFVVAAAKLAWQELQKKS